MQKFVQSLKNRIIFKMNGQSQLGLPIFKTKKVAGEIRWYSN